MTISSTWNGLKEFGDGDAALFNCNHVIDEFVDKNFKENEEFEDEFHRLLTENTNTLQLNLSSFDSNNTEDLYSTPPDFMKFETTMQSVKFEEDPLSAILNIEQQQQQQHEEKEKVKKRGRPPTIKFKATSIPNPPVKVVKSIVPETNLVHQQKLELRERRSDEDFYSPIWIRGRGVDREGLCPLCDPSRWFKIKQSAYWYHMNFYHGISATTGKPYKRPISYRMTPNHNFTRVEGHCGHCLQWILLATDHKNETKTNLEDNFSYTSWYKHAQKCHYRTKEFKIPF